MSQLESHVNPPETLTGIQVMRGEGAPPAHGFWVDTWIQVSRRPRAGFALVWIAIVGFFAVFAPLLASGHPVVMWELSRAGERTGEISSPLLQSLSAVDWMLVIGAFAGVVLMAMPLRWPRSHRLGVLIASAVQAAVIVLLAELMRRFDSSPRHAPLLAAGAAIVVSLIFLAIPTFRRWSARLALVALVGAVTAVVIAGTWVRPPETFGYRERELAGEIETMYTLVPWSPSQRLGDRDAKSLPPGATSDQALARILVVGLPPSGALGEREQATIRERLRELPIASDRRDALETSLVRQAREGPLTREQVRSFFNEAFASSGQVFPLGTDGFGQDVISQMMHAARLAISIGLVSTSIAVLIGVTVGSIMGYFGGLVDLLLYRVVEIFMAVPVLFLLIVAAGVLPRNTYVMMAIIGMFTWTTAARFTRAEFMKLRNQDFVQAAHATGLPLRSILFRHMLPNGVTPVLVDASFLIAAAILAEATLSYLGLGPVDQASWGKLLASAVNETGTFVWWLAIFPGFAIFLTVLSYNMLGEALRDAIDPKLKKAAH